MTLAQLRSQLRRQIFDLRSRIFSDSDLLGFLNAALTHVGNLADIPDQGHFLASADYTLTAADTGDVLLGFRTGHPGGPNEWAIPAARPVKRVVTLTWMNGPAAKPLPLRLDRRDDADYRKLPVTELAPTVEPLAALEGMATRIYNGYQGMQLRLLYVQMLTPLAGDGDVPDPLPQPFHPLIHTWATVLALDAMNVDSGKWENKYNALADTLQRTMVKDRGETAANKVRR